MCTVASSRKFVEISMINQSTTLHYSGIYYKCLAFVQCLYGVPGMNFPRQQTPLGPPQYAFQKYRARKWPNIRVASSNRGALWSHWQLLSYAESGPLLLLNGEVLDANSTIKEEQIMEGVHALLCVTTNTHCCNGSSNSSAQFLSPTDTPVTETPGSDLYVTKGKQMIRLNRSESGSALEGMYCCSIDDRDTICVDVTK
jgi:hypothetical protein